MFVSNAEGFCSFTIPNEAAVFSIFITFLLNHVNASWGEGILWRSKRSFFSLQRAGPEDEHRAWLHDTTFSRHLRAGSNSFMCAVADHMKKHQVSHVKQAQHTAAT